jgi:predicted nucleic acid-binding protein
MEEKILIFDSSTIISFSMNGLFPELKELKEIFDGHFIVPKEVREETIDKPLSIKRFELEALRMQQLLEEGIFETPECLGIKEKEISLLTQKILNRANELFYSSQKEVQIIGKGEASCLALSKLLYDKKIKSVIAIDERTTRILGEKPENLIKLLTNKLHTPIKMNKKNLDFIKGAKFIRSAEIIYVAYKKNLIKIKKEQALDALLYAMKFKGCAISDEEIEEIKRLG